ncbi:MAG: TonB-dependent receptor plug domain-containing protein [Gammaproteobacteria bacterium]|nr:TonB-dependent receptor plug domain-containing protein [Gammaproteobacteria bacterium]
MMETRRMGWRLRQLSGSGAPAALGALMAALALGSPAWGAQDEPPADEDVVELETFVAEDRAEDAIGILPTEPMDAVFGFDKTLLETPRSATSITIETIEQYGITEIDDFVVLSPGSFTQSFFGVSGSLDLRGTSGENYFNGVRRLDNPGNYATPIGAADRVDIVRGPASVIYGPSKIGGYMNFIPKSARAETGQFLSSPTGTVSFTGGRWSKSVLTAEVGGPGQLGERPFGYYLFGEVEDSGSYYDNTGTDNTILQGTFNMDLSERARIAFGGMYHDYKSNQVAGWNRLTQALIDDGTYTTGLAMPLDADGDGAISHQEYNAANDGAGLFSFTFNPAGVTGPVTFGPDFALDPATVGVAKLGGNQVLVASDDTLENEDLILYADIIMDLGEKWTVTNKLYFESYDNLNENAYGFSQYADSWVIENQLIVNYTEEFDALTLDLLFSPSIRHTDFEHANDFINEHFDRRDLTGPSTARDLRLLATRIDDDYTEVSVGDYTIYGLALLTDLDFNNGLNILLGGRFDSIDMSSSQPGHKTLFGSDIDASYTDDAFSWTASVSYSTPVGLVPYVTVSKQTTVVVGQGSNLNPEEVQAENSVASSKLFEVGVKGTFLNEQLFAQAIYYEQKRTDFSAQAIVTNQVSDTEGFEFELRWLVTPNLTLTAAYTNIEVVNRSTLDGGGRFSFLGAEDLPDTDPTSFYGGTAAGFVTLETNPKALRTGVPENIISVSGIYSFDNGLQLFGSVIDVDSAYSAFSQAVKLPAYTLVNVGAKYDLGSWSFTLTGKNLTDERYFRSNFPNLFGSAIVLPELPRHYQASVAYKF